METRYSVIYADPPWPYNKRNNSGTRFSSGVHGHYAVMSEEEIKAMGTQSTPSPDGGLVLPPIRAMADDNCVLFLWTTCPKLDLAVEVIKYWGFRYTTVGYIWTKVTMDSRIRPDRRGGDSITALVLPGNYTGSNAELLLIGARGSMSPVEKMLPQPVFHHRLAHSEKPEVFRERIDQMYPSGNRIELFARRRVTGWDAWGLEVGKLD